MSVDDDARLLLQHLDAAGVSGAERLARGWPHIGAVVVDATLQRRQRYRETVEPRVRAVVDAWPDAATTDGFLRRIASGELPGVIRWEGKQRLDQIEQMAQVLAGKEIQTVDDLARALGDADRRLEVRAALRAVPQVGIKTVDYLDILTGDSGGVAVDVRVRKVAAAAGIVDHSYAHLAAVIRESAKARGWRAGDLDAAIWSVGDDRRR